MNEHHSMTGAYHGPDVMDLPDDREEYIKIPMEILCREIELFKRSNPGYCAMMRSDDRYFAKHGRRYKPSHMFRAWIRAKAQVREELRQDIAAVHLHGEGSLVNDSWIDQLQNLFELADQFNADKGDLEALQDLLIKIRKGAQC